MQGADRGHDKDETARPAQRLHPGAADQASRQRQREGDQDRGELDRRVPVQPARRRGPGEGGVVHRGEAQRHHRRDPQARLPRRRASAHPARRRRRRHRQDQGESDGPRIQPQSKGPESEQGQHIGRPNPGARRQGMEAHPGPGDRSLVILMLTAEPVRRRPGGRADHAGQQHVTNIVPGQHSALNARQCNHLGH